MYLRTTRRSNSDGSQVAYFQLAHNVRNAQTGQASAQIIHNFGRADELNRDDLVRLCRSIARVCDLEVSDPMAEGGEGGERAVSGEDPLPGDIAHKRTRALGAVWVAQTLWDRLGIAAKLREVEKQARATSPYEKALFAMVANRMCAPSSKLGVWHRWLEEVWFRGVESLSLRHMYEAMDLLHAHAADVEQAVFFSTADLLNLEVDLVFYDTSVCQFSIDEEDDALDDNGHGGLRRLGRPKNGAWAPQVLVALAVTREGLPIRSWVFPGDTADVSTVQRIKRDLRGWKLGRALFVGDSAMNSEDNRQELLRGAGRYLLATRAGSVKEVHEEVLGRAGRYQELADNLRAKEVVVGSGELRRRYIVCHNPQETVRQREHRAGTLAQLEESLAQHPDLDAGQQWAVQLRASKRYGRYLKVGPGGKLAIDRTAARAAERMDGKWVLMTNDDTLSIEDAATGYKNLLVIERCFRALKTTRIQMMPMYHWLPRRIEAHVKICVLALLLERVAELRAGQPWPTLQRLLDGIQVTEFETPSHRFFRRNDMPGEATKILKALDIKEPSRILDVAPAAV